MQHARLIGAAVSAMNELGWSGVTVADITTRARVSRRTFYDLFSDREDCLLAVFDHAVGSIERELQSAGLEGCSWLVRVRMGLWTILRWLDRDPVLARVCVVQALRGEPRVLERRAEILVRLVGVLEEGRGESSREQTSGLTAEGLVGAAVTIVHARLLAGAREPLVDLTGELMGMIVLPYLGPSAARREQSRTDFVSRAATAEGSSSGGVSRQSWQDTLSDVPLRLTYRTAQVLHAAARVPGASNRVLGESAGITDQGQISKLLARLQRLGLLANAGVGSAKGEPNAWSLTGLGERVLEQLGLDTAAGDGGTV